MGKIRIFLMLIVTVFVLTSCGKTTTATQELPTTTEPTSAQIVTPTTTDKTPNTIQIKMNQYIDQLINETPSYVPAWNKEGFKARWNYVDGVFLNAIVNLYNETKVDKYKYFFLNYINYYINR